MQVFPKNLEIRLLSGNSSKYTKGYLSIFSTDTCTQEHKGFLRALFVNAKGSTCGDAHGERSGRPVSIRPDREPVSVQKDSTHRAAHRERWSSYLNPAQQGSSVEGQHPGNCPSRGECTAFTAQPDRKTVSRSQRSALAPVQCRGRCSGASEEPPQLMPAGEPAALGL